MIPRYLHKALLLQFSSPRLTTIDRLSRMLISTKWNNMMVSFEQTKTNIDHWTCSRCIQTSFHVLVADKDGFHRHRHVFMRECISRAPLLGTGTVRIRSRILDMSEWAIMRQEVQDGATETISEHLTPNDLVPDSSVMSVNLSNCGQPSSKKIISPSYDQTWENRQFCPWAW